MAQAANTTSTCNEAPSEKNGRDQDNDSPDFPRRPAGAAPDLVSQFVSQGPAGQALDEALQDLQDDPETSTLLDALAGQRISEAYGAAVVDSNWSDAPSALVRGRADHFNRFNGQWRIAVDETELRRRKYLAPSRRRKLDGLWERHDTDDAGSQERRGYSERTSSDRVDDCEIKDHAGLEGHTKQDGSSKEAQRSSIVSVPGSFQILIINDS